MANPANPMDRPANCKGSVLMGTGCGECTKCINEFNSYMPQLVSAHHMTTEVLTALHDELVTTGRITTNPKILARAIGGVLKEAVLRKVE